jgi:hypothetical protein
MLTTLEKCQQQAKQETSKPGLEQTFFMMPGQSYRKFDEISVP